MYAYIKGIATFANLQYIVLDVGGVGYKIFTTSRFLASVALEDTIILYTHLIVKEDELTLYGFEHPDELAIFEKLIGISGIGPKVALNIITTLTANEISAAINTGDDKMFRSVSGIGPKTAQRIVLELHGKVDLSEENLSGAGSAQDAVSALINLGYAQKEAFSAVNAVKDLADSVEDITLLALKRLSL